jgi:hypothetical protein
MQFLYEDRQGDIADEHKLEAMDFVIDMKLLAIEIISPCTQFLMNKPPERPSNPSIHLTLDEKSENVDMKLCNK